MHDGDGQDKGACSTRERVRAFGETADPDDYLARPPCEAALAALESTLRETEASAALCAPPGLGKTLLLHRLARRLEDRRVCIYLPYGALEIGELCRWALGRLAAARPELVDSPEGDDPLAELRGLATRLGAKGSGLVLLIDDAGSLPFETARSILALAAATPALGLVLAVNEDAVGSRLVASGGAALREVSLRTPMSLEETRDYVAARLDRAGITGPPRKRFDEPGIAWIHRLSGGVPRRVHELANELLECAAHEVRTRIREEPGVQDLLDDMASLDAMGSADDEPAGMGPPELEYDLDDAELLDDVERP